MYFPYGEKEIAHLKAQDPALGRAIDRIGLIQRPLDPDLFSSVVRHIVGQQISSAAQATVWSRIEGLLGSVTAATVTAVNLETLQATGLTFRKARNILAFARQVEEGSFSLTELARLSDEDVATTLMKLPGVGPWTAEMILLFGLERPDVFSFGDLGIRRGLEKLHGLEKIDRTLFNHYRERYRPYGSVASLYVWAIAGGALNEETSK